MIEFVNQRTNRFGSGLNERPGLVVAVSNYGKDSHYAGEDHDEDGTCEDADCGHMRFFKLYLPLATDLQIVHDYIHFHRPLSP
jgi:hypothetical protein